LLTAVLRKSALLFKTMNKNIFNRDELHSSTATSSADRDSHPGDFSVTSINDSSNTREFFFDGQTREFNGVIPATGASEDQRIVSNKRGSVFARDSSCSKRTDTFFNGNTPSQSMITKQHVKGTTLNTRSQLETGPSPDTGGKVERKQFTSQSSLEAKKQMSARSSEAANRRMSCPAKFSLNTVPSNDRRPKWVTRLPMESDYNLGVEESRNCLPKIIHSMETLSTQEEDFFEGNSGRYEMRSRSKSTSPKSFPSEKSVDQIFQESKKRLLTSARSDGNCMAKNKPLTSHSNITETTYSMKPHDIGSTRSFCSIIDDRSESKRKVKFELKPTIDHDNHSSEIDVLEEFRYRTRRRAQSEGKKETAFQNRETHLKLRSRVLSVNDFQSQRPQSTKVLGDELNWKVKAFLTSSQPKASPETLKVKREKKNKIVVPNTSGQARQERKGQRLFINTDTCPSSAQLIDQDRSWYYQDRRGKCRYLRVPESPAPPVEWVFRADGE